MFNKYNKNIGDNEFIINRGMIIILLNYHPFSQLLIGCLKDETNFFPLSLIHFEDKNELYNYYSKLKKINFQTINKELKENNNKIYDKKHTKEVGILFNLEKRNDEKKEITPICGERGNNFENKENKTDIIKHLIELYFAFDHLNSLIKDNSRQLFK